MKKLLRVLGRLFLALLFLAAAALVTLGLLRWRGLILLPDEADPDEWEVFGVDVSSYQGEVDWPVLAEQGVDAIFYPCMPYNFNEGVSDNNYNCPVVAYYPELLAANVPDLKRVRYLYPYFGLHRPRDFERKAGEWFFNEFQIPKRETAAAAKAAYAAYEAYKDDLRQTARTYIVQARAEGRPILVVAGRPYHMDPEINHGINDLITSFGFTLITEDSVAWLEDKAPRHVLNQWTYHARMYNAARYVCTQPDMDLIQLVSFGCGIDAITGDEMRSILEGGGKLYTQLKIDDISNLGAVKIRIRSLMAAIEARKAQ